MTLIGFLRGVFCYRSIGAAKDQDRRQRETDQRVDHAQRVLGNSYERLNGTSNRLRELSSNIAGQEYVDAMRQLSKTLDNR